MSNKSKSIQILERFGMGMAGGIGGVAGAGLAYGAGSLFGYLSDYFSPPKQLIDFESPEFKRAMQMNVDRNLNAEAAHNPLAVSPAAQGRIADDTKAAAYMEARKLNAPYDPQLQSSQMTARQVAMGQMTAYGGGQNIIGGFGDITADLWKQWRDRGKEKETPWNVFSKQISSAINSITPKVLGNLR